ncbi:MAG TPA: envelope stress response membrane protein PspC [Stellaceae bacterium]|nr:envelope stress response membrane protein PspC [Stellaceae bacterium]
MWTDARARLYRDPENGIIAGVAAGIARYFGAEPIAIRLAFVLGLFLFLVPALAAYIVLWIALPQRPPALFTNREDEAFWRGLANEPDTTLQHLRHRFGDLEVRLRAMESHVASPDFDLHRKFRDL